MVSNKRLVLGFFAFFLIISSSLVLADGDVIVEDWFEFDEVFVHGSDIYDLRLYSNNFLRVSKNDEGSISLGLEECVYGFDYYEFCFLNKSFSSSKATIDDRGVAQPAVELKIIRLAEPEGDVPDASVSFSKTGSSFLFEEHEGVITLNNTGNVFIRDGSLVLEFPSSIEIVDRGDFLPHPDGLRLPFNLARRDSGEFSFSFKVVETGRDSFDYKVVYDSESIASGDFRFRGVRPYDFSISYVDEFDIGTSQDFIVTIKNNHDVEDLVVDSLQVIGPVQFNYFSSQRLSSSGAGRYSTSGISLPPGAERAFSVRYSAGLAGSFNFDVLTTLKYGYGHNFSHSFQEEVTSISEGVSADFGFSRNTISLGASSDLVLSLKNDHSSLIFRDFEVEVVSPLFNATFERDVLRPNEGVDLFEENIMPPQLEEDVEYFANVSISFSNDAGQSEVIELSDALLVIGEGDLFKVSKDLSSRSVEAEGEVLVEVFLESLVDNRLSVVVSDSFSQAVDLVTGSTSFDSAISGRFDERIYLYKVRLPELPVSDVLEILTLVEVPSIGHEAEFISSIDVEAEEFGEPPEEDEFVEAEEEGAEEDGGGDDERDPSEYEAVPLDDDEDVGFFRRMFRGIERFFANLF